MAADPIIGGWAARSWPLVARRRSVADRPGCIALGLPLPPSHGKRRVALDLARTAVLSVSAPPRLEEVCGGAPTAWRRTIDCLLELAGQYDITPRVFGSFAWAHLTGLDYLTPESDLDLLWPLMPRTRDLLPRLASIERGAPGRIDGEVVDAHGAAANWRELLGNPARVLVKTLVDVRLVEAEAFLRSDTVPA